MYEGQGNDPLTLFVRRNGHTNGHANGHGNVEKTSKTDPLASLKQALAPFREDGTSLDAETRHAMIAMLQETSESLETSRDMLMRFCESVSRRRDLRVWLWQSYRT